ncbi:DNA-methyltransferase Dcm [Beggiatoa alba B18LD]|uniref:Cytosine-specific methyltransferase n=1 Tax=Beggiatoa alba B18LD TaxID=395493 RepID=I3CK75_9GAMM|nr:DNA cytosine methyltransferase [Beggiatoa alba]EIJ44018.1 DNA-methyltransferase Dcm [Beggiatoa alba B18LD]
MYSQLNIVDLFCGCGGFGLGAELAGFHTIAAVDIDSTLQSAYKYNFPNTYVINGDLSKMSHNSWSFLNNQNIDVVIGGPPCQGFSRMGIGDLNDPRRTLINDFFRHINILLPKFFVMENVEGLLDKKHFEVLNQAIESLNKRYRVLPPFIVNASDFGVPTKRKRVFVIGYDKNTVEPIEINLFSVQNKQVTVQVTVKDAISDLPSPLKENSHKTEFGWKAYKTSQNLSDYAQQMRKMPAKHLGNIEARQKLEQNLTSGHFNTHHMKVVQDRYVALQQGGIDQISKSKRLEWSGLCPTLRAGTGSDRGSYQAVRPIHPDEPRVITVREAARLQGFPDWFCFHPTKWHSFRMIGNSVSPLVSFHIMRLIKAKLTQDYIKSIEEIF